MGFPDTFRIPVSDTQAYRQFGNSVVVPVVHAVAETMRPHVVALKVQQEARQVGLPVWTFNNMPARRVALGAPA